MRILNITNVNFSSGAKYAAGNSALRSGKPDTKTLLYNDIDAFLNKKCDKDTYIKNLRNNVKTLDNLNDFTPEENAYIYDVFMTLDDVGGVNNLSEGYLKNLMNNLINNSSSK